MKKLAIVGSGSNTRHNAPFEDESFDIWVFNEAANMTWCKRWSACFQMHEPEIYTGHNTKDACHWEWLQKPHGKPIYMQDVDPRVPDSVRFPLEDAIALVDLSYFSATFAYMAALARMQGYEQIDIHGIELSHTEYQYQAECWRFWVGYLKGAGIQVNLYSGQQLFEAPLYGYEGNFAFGVEFFEERVNVLDAQWFAAEKSAKNIRKAIDLAVTQKKYDKITMLTKDFQAAMITSGEAAGALAEAERYQTFGNRYADRGGFEYAAAKAQRDGEEKKPLVWHLGGMVEYAWTAWKQTGNEFAKSQMLAVIDRMGETAYDMGALFGMYKENISYVLKYDATVKAGGRVLLEATA